MRLSCFWIGIGIIVTILCGRDALSQEPCVPQDVQNIIAKINLDEIPFTILPEERVVAAEKVEHKEGEVIVGPLLYTLQPGERVLAALVRGTDGSVIVIDKSGGHKMDPDVMFPCLLEDTVLPFAPLIRSIHNNGHLKEALADHLKDPVKSIITEVEKKGFHPNHDYNISVTIDGKTWVIKRQGPFLDFVHNKTGTVLITNIGVRLFGFWSPDEFGAASGLRQEVIKDLRDTFGHTVIDVSEMITILDLITTTFGYEIDGRGKVDLLQDPSNLVTDIIRDDTVIIIKEIGLGENLNEESVKQLLVLTEAERVFSNIPIIIPHSVTPYKRMVAPWGSIKQRY